MTHTLKIILTTILIVSALTSYGQEESGLSELNNSISTAMSKGEFPIELMLSYDSLATAGEDAAQIAQGKYFLAEAYRNKRLFNLARENYDAATAGFQASGNNAAYALASLGSAELYKDQGQNGESIQAYQQALNGYKKENNVNGQLDVLYTLAKLQATQGQASQAITNLGKATQLAAATNDTTAITRDLAYQSEIGSIAGNYGPAIRSAKSYLRNFRANHTPKLTAITQLGNAISLGKTGKTFQARPAFAEALSGFNRLGDQHRVAETYKYMSEMERAVLNYRNASKYKDKWDNYQDSLLAIKHQAEIDQVSGEFVEKTRAKDAEYDRMSEELDGIKSSKSTVRNILIGALALTLMTLGGFIFFLLNDKRKKSSTINSLNATKESLEKERKTLTTEIKSRVSNNVDVLSYVMGILDKSNATSSDPKKKIRRDYAVRILRQNIAQWKDLEGIGMVDYFKKLEKELYEQHREKEHLISFSSQVQHMKLDADTVIPLGIICNEVIHNALQHAFRQGEKGNINLSLKEENNRLMLQIIDNGQGVSDPSLPIESGGTGYTLIHRMAGILDAELTVRNDKGTSLQLAIKNYKKMA